MSIRYTTLAIIAFVFFGGIIPASSQQAPESAPHYKTAAEVDKALNVNSQTPCPTRFIRLAYFHRVPGCQTCQIMSRYVFETVETKFAPEAESKKLVLRYIDFENPRYAAQTRAYKISGPTLTAIEVQNGKDVRYWRLDKIWTFAGNKAQFQNYVETELKRIMQSAEETETNQE